MFRTELLHFLQGFESETLTLLMKAVTSLGYEQFFFVFLIAIITTVDFKKGFLLIQIMIVTGIITQIGKDFFALPRPWFVDNSLQVFGKNLNTPFTDSGATSFLGLLPSNIIEAYRNYSIDSFGLPSGHTSSAVALWGSLIILFKQRWVRYLSITLIILVPLSRLYLARHFLADVIAGYLLGLLILILFYIIIYRKDKLNEYLPSDKLRISISVRDLLLLGYLLLLPIISFIFSQGEAVKLSGYLFGINTVYLLISRQSYPQTPQGFRAKAVNLITTLLVFAALGALITILFNTLFAENYKVVLFMESALIVFGSIYLGTTLNTYLNTRLSR